MTKYAPADYAYQHHPLRVRRSRAKGARLPAGTVCVTRPGRWGNPFAVEAERGADAEAMAEARGVAAERFRDWLLRGPQSPHWIERDEEQARWEWMRANVALLRGKTLACYCPLDGPCHGDVLAEFANRNGPQLVKNSSA